MMMSRIVCLSPLTEDQVRGLAKGFDVEAVVLPGGSTPEEVRAAVADADIVIGDGLHRYHLDAGILAAMRRCRLVQQPSVGFDGIDVESAARLGIPVSNSAGYNLDSVADWVVMAVLNLIRHGAWGDRQMRAGEWPMLKMLGRELGALTVGLVGVGNTGGAVADRLRAFGSRVLFYDVVPRSVTGAESCELNEVLARSDVVSVHVPLDASTRGLIDTAAIERMKQGAYLINSSRGPVVDEEALIAALKSGRLAAAALDVFATEPLPADSELRRLENVFMTPHAAAFTRDANERVLAIVAANIRRVLSGEPPFNVVNTARPQQEN
ncbi:hypothetical protein DP939_20640 [Spongiactinospora rosea]|uniref:Hydroxyacid dehydrogenase n=2 Tax=Spongiactinospora rosea TaxID=2248750 RepID=A0A366LY99_9ACTN|nr:hypothetical protein DP939_20640 [Spongiactinospora rosea]